MLRKRRVLAAIVLVVLAASAVVGFGLVGRESEASSVDEFVFIPIVIGMPQQDAIAAIEAAGLRAEIRYEPHGAAKSEGLVVVQGPVSSRVTWRGNSIGLTVARR